MDGSVEVLGLVERVQELTDVELAMLLGLIAGQHCIIQTEREALSSLEQEIQLVRCKHIFVSAHMLKYWPDRLQYIWSLPLGSPVQPVHNIG